MKNILYFIFGIFFSVSRIFKVKRNRVMLMSLHNEGENGALSMLESALNDYGEYEIIWFNRSEIFASAKGKIRFFTYYAKMMATSNFIFLNDNFMPMANMNFSKDTVVIQLWHGPGAMKRSCLAEKLPEKTAARLRKINSKLDWLVVSSKAVIPVYEETFGIDKSKIIALGAARFDYFFKNSKDDARKAIDEKYPQCKGKKLVLYAPTFRDDDEKNDALLNSFPFDEFNALEDYCLMVRLHPQAGGLNSAKGKCIDATDYPSAGELALAADILISDYSSIIQDFAVQDKPIALYAFDLDYFNNNERGFYFDYESYAPGPVAKTPEELIEIFKSCDFKDDKRKAFADFNFDYRDKYNCIRIIEKLVK